MRPILDFPWLGVYAGTCYNRKEITAVQNLYQLSPKVFQTVIQPGITLWKRSLIEQNCKVAAVVNGVLNILITVIAIIRNKITVRFASSTIDILIPGNNTTCYLSTLGFYRATPR